MPNLRRDGLGRRDGGATRLFNHPQLGSLISACHSGIIKAGNELETLIERHATTMDEQHLLAFLDGQVQTGVWLISKKLIKTVLKKKLGVSNEPDFVMALICETTCHIIELKDGDTFDTKKSDGEVQSLRAFANALRSALPTYAVYIKVVSFNAATPQQVVAGLKGRITLDEAWTGQDFCRKLGISYQTIIDQRTRDCEDNIDYFLEQLLSMPDIHARLSKLLGAAR